MASREPAEKRARGGADGDEEEQDVSPTESKKVRPVAPTKLVRKAPAPPKTENCETTFISTHDTEIVEVLASVSPLNLKKDRLPRALSKGHYFVRKYDSVEEAVEVLAAATQLGRTCGSALFAPPIAVVLTGETVNDAGDTEIGKVFVATLVTEHENMQNVLKTIHGIREAKEAVSVFAQVLLGLLHISTVLTIAPYPCKIQFSNILHTPSGWRLPTPVGAPASSHDANKNLQRLYARVTEIVDFMASRYPEDPTLAMMAYKWHHCVLEGRPTIEDLISEEEYKARTAGFGSSAQSAGEFSYRTWAARRLQFGLSFLLVPQDEVFYLPPLGPLRRFLDANPPLTAKHKKEMREGVKRLRGELHDYKSSLAKVRAVVQDAMSRIATLADNVAELEKFIKAQKEKQALESPAQAAKVQEVEHQIVELERALAAGYITKDVKQFFFSGETSELLRKKFPPLTTTPPSSAPPPPA